MLPVLLLSTASVAFEKTGKSDQIKQQLFQVPCQAVPLFFTPSLVHSMPGIRKWLVLSNTIH